MAWCCSKTPSRKTEAQVQRGGLPRVSLEKQWLESEGTSRAVKWFRFHWEGYGDLCMIIK